MLDRDNHQPILDFTLFGQFRTILDAYAVFWIFGFWTILDSGNFDLFGQGICPNMTVLEKFGLFNNFGLLRYFERF